MSNVDAQELAKFSELAHRWWDPESEFKPLHQINPLRLDWIDGLCPLKGKTVIKVDERFFRPAEVELLLGNPDKARKELGVDGGPSIGPKRS